MLIEGTIESVDNSRMTVRLDEEFGGELSAVAEAIPGAAPGDRVALSVPEFMGEGRAGVIYSIPLAGVLAGAVGGKVLSQWPPLAEGLKSMGGPLLGNILASGDNMALAFGGLGLAGSAALVIRHIRSRKRHALGRASVADLAGEASGLAESKAGDD